MESTIFVKALFNKKPGLSVYHTASTSWKPPSEIPLPSKLEELRLQASPGPSHPPGMGISSLPPKPWPCLLC